MRDLDHAFDGCAFCFKQAQRVETLEEEVRQLKAQLYRPVEWEPPREFHLTPAESAILQALVKANGRTLSKDFLISATREVVNRREDPETKTIDTMVCKMRAKIAPFNVPILTDWSKGFRIEASVRQRLLNWNAERVAA